MKKPTFDALASAIKRDDFDVIKTVDAFIKDPPTYAQLAMGGITPGNVFQMAREAKRLGKWIKDRAS